MSTLHVSLTGDDGTGDGTLGNPYRTLLHAVDEAVAGDTIYLRGGFYDTHKVDTYLRDGSSYPGEVRCSGTSGSPITISSYPGEWAIIDGGTNPDHPRVFGDTSDAYEPYLVQFVGEWVNWENLEFRNSYGGGFRAFALDCKWTGCVFRNNHAVGFNLQGSRNEISYCIARDNYSVSNDGNSANGYLVRYSSQLNLAGRFPAETQSSNNHFHHNIADHNSDDGFGANTSKNNLWEHNVSLSNGFGATGNGEGFKMGFAGNPNSGNVFRFNISAFNKTGFNTNYSTGVLCHNNTALDTSGISFALWVNSTVGSGLNEAYNNLSYEPGSAHRAREVGVTIHKNNAGFSGRWDPGADEGNFHVSNVDPQFVSVDPDSVDFLRLAVTSPYLTGGSVITGGSTTLGAIPDGQDFAGGWDWQALRAQHPRVDAWPMPQETLDVSVAPPTAAIQLMGGTPTLSTDDSVTVTPFTAQINVSGLTVSIPNVANYNDKFVLPLTAAIIVNGVAPVVAQYNEAVITFTRVVLKVAIEGEVRIRRG